MFLLALRSARSQQDVHQVQCDYGDTSCRCNESATACEFNLRVSYLQTFTRYPVRNQTDISDLDGVVHRINASGDVVSYDGNIYEDGYTEAATVDGKTFRAFIAVNGRSPGPTLIVSEGQTVIVNVRNEMRGQSITIHWHGQLLKDTPWMDGVGYITQCPLTTGGTFRYIFKAQPSGTFWYHSHVDGQRGDGLLGALIVLERDADATYLDLPEQHTLVLQDWWPQPFIDLFTVMHSVGETYYPSTIGELPTNAYSVSILPDGSEHGSIPFFSGLINGLGKHSDVPYESSRLTSFQVTYGNKYRFRVIGGQMLYGYKVSVDRHKLTVISTDGFLIRPVSDVDYIIVYPGERYDFVLTADQIPTRFYWIRAETLEVNTTAFGPPYPSLGNSVQAVLYYSNATKPTSKDYSIIDSTPRSCTQSAPCIAVNCPFQDFHESYNVTCINVDALQLLKPSSNESLPSNDPTGSQEHFLNFGYSGLDGMLPDNINGRSFMHPPAPLQLQSFDITDLTCPTEPYSCGEGCRCLHMLTIPYNNTVRLVLANLGRESHAIHLHGHSYYVLAVGYGSYESSSGFVSSTNESLSCQANENDTATFEFQLCTTLHWRTGLRPSVRLSPYTLRKDTVIVPSGGYVIIQFVSSSPGYWFLHCHLDPHHLEGMAMVLNIAQEMQNPPPAGMSTCGDFNWSLSDFYSKLSFQLTPTSVLSQTIVPSTSMTHLAASSSLSPQYCSCIGWTQLAIAAAITSLGTLTLLSLPCIMCLAVWCKNRKKTSDASANRAQCSQCQCKNVACRASVQHVREAF